MTFIIGLSGYAQSGKDTVAEQLVKEFNFTQASFAAPMKDAMYKLNPLIESDKRYQEVVDLLGIDAAKVQYPEIRRLLQVFGTEVGRTMFGENFWVDLCLNNVKGHRSVISDVRFPNEADAIKERGGVVWRITRPGVTPVTPHPSEVSMDDYMYDELIINDGTIEELKLKVIRTLSKYTSRWP